MKQGTTRQEVERRLRRAPRVSGAMRRFGKRSVRFEGKSGNLRQVAAAAGYPLYHRHVAQLLHKCGNSCLAARSGRRRSDQAKVRGSPGSSEPV